VHCKLDFSRFFYNNLDFSLVFFKKK